MLHKQALQYATQYEEIRSCKCFGCCWTVNCLYLYVFSSLILIFLINCWNGVCDDNPLCKQYGLCCWHWIRSAMALDVFKLQGWIEFYSICKQRVPVLLHYSPTVKPQKAQFVTLVSWWLATIQKNPKSLTVSSLPFDCRMLLEHPIPASSAD